MDSESIRLTSGCEASEELRSRVSGEDSNLDTNTCKVAYAFGEGPWSLLPVVPLTMLDRVSFGLIPAIADTLLTNGLHWR